MKIISSYEQLLVNTYYPIGTILIHENSTLIVKHEIDCKKCYFNGNKNYCGKVVCGINTRERKTNNSEETYIIYENIK